MSCDFKIVIEELDGPIYKPFWPFKRKTTSVHRIGSTGMEK